MEMQVEYYGMGRRLQEKQTMAIIILKTQDNIGQCCLLWGDKNDPVMTMIPEI
jgi:hypothetical protein